MGVLENVKKTVGESKIGGTKNRLLWAPKSIIATCPALDPMADRTTTDQSKYLVGDFVFVTPLTDKFNAFEFDVSSGELKWKAEGTGQSKIMMLNFEMEVSTLDSSLYLFVEKYQNEDLIIILERADCSGERFLFGGCCLPATITGIEGSLGKTAKDFGSTKIGFEAFSNGMPPLLPMDAALPVYDNLVIDGDYDLTDHDDTDFF